MNPFMKSKSTVRIAAWLILLSTQPLYASTLTIGKGTGEVWRGDPFSTTRQLILNSSSDPSTTGGAASITNSTSECIASSSLTTIGGVAALPIAPGIGLVPAATFNVSTYSGPTIVRMDGTIGLSGTQGTMSTGGSAAIPAGRAWCLNFSGISPSIEQRLVISGEWVILTDGTQRSGLYTIPQMYAGTFASDGRNTAGIITYTNLRVNFVSCTITTNTNINFGTVARDITPHAELSSQSTGFAVTCGQDDPNTIDTNINVQFSGNMFEGNTSRLALNEGGGYITGEIGNGVTGSGTCDATTGVNFNSTDINVGVLTASTLNQTFDNQITWRLCSGGASLPTGSVNASANVAVTYN